MKLGNSSVKTISKVFGDFPFSHRQATHDGHCKTLHGHNWKFKIKFQCLRESLDINGFVIDFGKMKSLKAIFADRFDHKTVLATNDPLAQPLMDFLHTRGINNVVLVPSASCEGIAELVHNMTEDWLISEGYTDRWVHSVEVFEDENNTAISNL